MCIYLYNAPAAACEELLQDKNHLVPVYSYTIPAINGSNVTFSCPPGMVVSGPEILTCMENGKWEPDPMMVECIGMTIFYIITIILFIIADCMSQTCAESKTGHGRQNNNNINH